MGNRQKIVNTFYSIIFLTIIALLYSCSSEDEIREKNKYEITVEVEFEQIGFILELSYINDLKQNKQVYQFQNSTKDDKINDINTHYEANERIGVYLGNLSNNPTKKIKIKIKNLTTNRIKAETIITKPLTKGNDSGFLFFYYNIRKDKVIEVFGKNSEFF
ncbi:hypothetical protein [Polaribacter sp. SA4-12]|uniref:hypothetical protein n=1 Tax=Polaribacter sp. SA4-12 TaxID=1312072 RepID=UPI000B3D4F33|nr:hypothetical protein [Polaribacter sp. SA4-12]ARV15356.1 hypothetical protein BTO07_09475 [Polaribacter sp. SA4-12]